MVKAEMVQNEQGLQSMGERRKEYIDALRAADRGNYELLFAFAGYSTEGVRQDNHIV